MSKTAYQKTALTGGTATSLDGINGSSLTDGDFAYVMVSNVLYTYVLNASSGATESTPDVVSPDSNAGTKRWILQKTPIQGGGTGQATAATAFSALKQSATESATGVAELATTAEAIAGTDTSRIVTPAGLAAAQAVISNPKAIAQAISMTATSGSTGIKVATDDDLNMATNNFGFACMDALPDITPSADVILAQKHDGSNGWIFKVLTTGYLRLTINATNYDSTATLASIGCIDKGRMFPHFSVTRESASVAGSVVFGVSGVQLGASVAITAGVPTTVSNTSTMYILGGSTVRYAGITSFNGLTNFAPTIAEWLEVFRLGTVPESWKWGSQTAVYTSDFSAGVDSWTANVAGTTLTGNTDSINGSDNWLKIERTDVSAGRIDIQRATGALTADKRQWAGITIYNPVGSGISYFSLGISGMSTTVGAISVPEGTEVTVSKLTFSAESSNTGLYLGPCTSGGVLTASHAQGTIFYIKAVTTGNAGATLALEHEGIQPAPGQWLDSSGNNLHALQPAVGSSLTRPKRDFIIKWTNTWAGTHELQYIGGVNQAILPPNCYIDSIIGVITGGTIEDIIIGDGSDTDRWVTITTGLAAGTVAFTIANAISDGTNYKMTVDPDANFTGSITWTINGKIL